MTSQVQTRELTLKQLKHNLWIHIIESIRKEPYGTDSWLELSKIAPPIEFLTSHPSPKKISTYTKFYIDNGYFDKPIVVQKNENNKNSDLVFLRDGYIRYLIAVKNNMKTVPIKWYKRGNK